MAQQPPKRYEPGELEKTRKHLGEISQDEARKMAKLLGGEIGVEKTSAEIGQKYRKIGDLNRRRRDRFATPSRPIPRARPPISEERQRRHADGAVSQATATSPHPGYFDRLRMDFLASRPEYGLKTRGSAFAAVFSLFTPVSDFVNPRFITDADDRIFKSIESLVLSVRHLLTLYAKTPLAHLRIPYYEEILTVISNWDLKALNKEIARLQSRPRRLPAGNCAELARLVFRPMVLLLDLDPNYHIAQALKHIHDIDLASIPKDSPDAPKIKLAYTMGREMIVRVFIDLKQHLYPLLMKLAAVRFSAYSDFYDEQRSLILDFLRLDPSQIIEPKDHDKVTPQPINEEKKVDSAEVERETPPEGAEEEESPGGEGTETQSEQLPDVERGLEFLDELFPQAGFRRIAEFPDMYSYFQPLLKLPKGVELISPEDPLQQIIVLVAFLQEVFYGFRSIKFYNIGTEESEVIETAQKMESLTGNWHLFLDEIIGKSYISTLHDYCRQVQSGDASLRGSEYRGKLESKLMWIKRRFFLPHLKAKIIRGLTPNIATDLPRLPQTVAEMRELLENVVNDVSSGSLKSMENPWETFSFAVESYLSKRLRAVLARRHNPENFLQKRVSNVSLIFHTLLVLRVLDYLVNDPQSFYISSYAELGEPLFRANVGKDGAPQYSVAAEDTFKLIEQSDRSLLARNNAKATKPMVDETTQMQTAPIMAKKVRAMMESYDEDDPFVLLPVTLRKYSEIVSEQGNDVAEGWLKSVAEIIAVEIREFEDLPYRVGPGAFIVVLPSTSGPDAVHLADRLARRFIETEEGKLPISMGIVEYRSGWSIERLLKAAQSAVRAAAKLPSPSIVTHEVTTDTFIPHL